MSVNLEVRDLAVEYRRPGTLADSLAGRPSPRVHALNGVSLTLASGDTLGLVGESGCGKSTFGRAILRLTRASAGQVLMDGEDVLTMDRRALARLRRRAQMVFQDPLASLNPRLSVAETLAEVLRVHDLAPRAEIPDRVRALMAQVGLPAELAGRRGASLSGGQCQRVGIARALAMGAGLIVADEPISALDVSIQAQILNLFTRLQQERNLTLIFISHDLGVVRYLCRWVAVMYLGRIVEEGPVETVFDDPRHPYTRTLIAAIPRMSAEARLAAASAIGEPPSPMAQPAGCPFHPRCPEAMPQCREGEAPAERAVAGRLTRCHLYPETHASQPSVSTRQERDKP
jgi:peptide/nickel transport system ATP-binding protein